MAIDPHYIPAFSIEDVILDKDTGAPLSGGQVYFEQDNQRGVFKPIYQITGTSPNYQYIQLPNPMTLSSIGTFEDSLANPTVPYFYPFDARGNPEYYFVRVESSGAVPQFTREAVPYIPSDLNPSDNAVNFGNEMSNPQFAEVLFDTVGSSYVYNFSGATLEAIEIAPNWEIVVSGTGTVTVSQSKPTGSLNRLTNPGTLLNINSSGISVLRLRQRMYGSPNLFGSGYISGFFVAKTFGGSSSILDMKYRQSSGTLNTTPILIKSATLTGTYTAFSGNALIPASNSTEEFPDAYIDIEFNIPVSTNIELTSVQVVGTGAISVDTVPYDEESNARQIDHLFHYYQPQINFKPISSLLTGWDFPLNPAQQLGVTTTITTTPTYKWDQTISVVNGGSVSVDRDTVTGGIQATTSGVNQAFCWIQYLSGGQAKKIIDTRLSVNVNAFRTQAGTDVTCRVYLYRGSSSAVFPTLPLLIGAISTDGTFTKNSTAGQGQFWTEIVRSNLGQAIGTLSIVDTGDYSTLSDIEDLQFSGWEVTDATEISDTDKFCIIVTFQCPTSGTVVTTNSIGLVPGDIPTRPAPQSKDEVIRECQYYYETSRNTGIPINYSGVGTAGGALIATQNYAATTNTVSMFLKAFGFQFRTSKRSTSSITRLYTPSGTADMVTGFMFNGVTSIGTDNITATAWTASNVGNYAIQYLSNTALALYNGAIVAAPANNTDAYIMYHFECDNRLGVTS